MFYLPTRRTHQTNAQIPKIQTNPARKPTHTKFQPHLHSLQPPTIYPKQKDEPTLIMKPTKDTLELPETRKEKTKDPKINKTGTKRALSTASERNNKKPVKPNDPDVDTKGPNPQILKKES